MMDVEESIRNIISAVNKFLLNYEYNLKEIPKLEGEHNDITHEYSLGKLKNMFEAYDLYERDREILQLRYKYKHQLASGEYLYNVITKTDLKKELSRSLTNLKKVKKANDNQQYVARVRTDLTIPNHIQKCVDFPFKKLLEENINE